MSERTINGTIISVIVKETTNGKEYRHLSIMPENETEVIELNAFDNKVKLDVLEEGKQFSFILVENGSYINLEGVMELPAGEQMKLTEDQKKIAAEVKYKNEASSIKKTVKQMKARNAPKIEAVESIYKELSKVECDTDKKGKFTYVSWAVAWDTIKKLNPNVNSKIYENQEGKPYFEVLNGLFVKVGVTINEQEHICWYPVLDNLNKEIPKDQVTVFDLNKSLQRALAKAIALHGLGLYVFKGEDLPEVD